MTHLRPGNIGDRRVVPFVHPLTGDDVRERLDLMMRLFRKRLLRMPLWLADDFSKVLFGAARGPILEFEMRCHAQRATKWMRELHERQGN